MTSRRADSLVTVSAIVALAIVVALCFLTGAF
jgi:hypothetical protein